ncbi:MAG TPA: hypothetical protein VM241_04795, partial [Candidatus Thermoplasmatota archaeon]|nr:hypothetical protein [Candidatus Thermoplasmatota archaeon]
GSADYARPRVTGVVKVGVTNRRLDKKGLPAGKPGDTLRAYGGGSVELTLSPKLKGKVGLQLLPNGEVEIEGELRPAPLTLFKEIAWPSKQIGPTLHFEIPIFGVSALGYSFGIFATIGGKVSLNAGVGPGEVNNLVASVKYNPAHPERTTLAGSAGLHIPAHAGVRLAVFCGIGAGLAIADVVAGIEVGGELGMKAALDAGLDVAWSPQGGLVVDATASAYAQPSFTLDVKGYVDVNLLKTNVYHTDMDLARFEFGSALRLGLLVPIHYEENKPFALAFDKVQFTVPDLNPKAALDAAVTKAADGGKKE